MDTRISDNDDLSSIAVDKDVYRQLIHQLYEGSIQRYGIDSDQSRMFKMHLTEHGWNDLP
ncbi:MAG: hypothetical protein ABI833_13125 [Acidobacteriota bacterium]